MPFKHSSFVLLLCASGLGGCDAEIEDPSTSPRAEPATSFVDDVVDDERCQRISQRASALIANTMTCHNDGECEAIAGAELIEDPCLPQLLCFVGASRPGYRPPFLDELRQLDDAYRDACGTCPMAMCQDPALVDSTCDQGHCDLTVAPSPDELAIDEQL